MRWQRFGRSAILRYRRNVGLVVERHRVTSLPIPLRFHSRGNGPGVVAGVGELDVEAEFGSEWICRRRSLFRRPFTAEATDPRIAENTCFWPAKRRRSRPTSGVLKSEIHYSKCVVVRSDQDRHADLMAFKTEGGGHRQTTHNQASQARRDLILKDKD